LSIGLILKKLRKGKEPRLQIEFSRKLNIVGSEEVVLAVFDVDYGCGCARGLALLVKKANRIPATAAKTTVVTAKRFIMLFR